MNPRPFGTADGLDVHEITIGDGAGLEARIITWGAVLRDLVVPGPAGPAHVVLGLDTMDGYLRHSRNFGAVVGRYANRIGQARFALDGRTVILVPNEDGSTLHGGPAGFGRRVWTLAGHDARSVRLSLVSADGDMGFPGRVEATALYEAVAPRTLRVTLDARTDAPTALNLAPHTYYNLDGSPDVREHRLEISAGFVTPTDPDGIPTGEVRPVAGTRYDFSTPRPIRNVGTYQPLDINFALAGGQGDGLRQAARLRSDRTGTTLDLWTTEPGLQVYDASRVDVPGTSRVDVPGTSPGDVPLRPFCGVALEPQRFPDGPNHAHFPTALLRPGTLSRQVTEMRFGSERG